MNRRHLAAVAVVLAVGVTAVYGTVALPTDSFGGPSESPASVDEPNATDAPDPADDDSDGDETDGDETDGDETDANDSADREVPYVAYSGDELALNATTDQVVRAETALDEGETVAVRLKSSGSSPFIISRDATVGADGSVEATFDLCGVNVDDSAPVTAYVAHDGDRIANASGTVYAVDADCSTPTPEADGARFVHDGDRITLDPATGQVVRGETDLAAGTEVVVRLRSNDGDQPFIKSRQVIVGEDGTFEATFDMADIDPGQSFEATLYHDDEQLASEDGRVAE